MTEPSTGAERPQWQPGEARQPGRTGSEQSQWNKSTGSGLYLPTWLTNSLPPHLVENDARRAGGAGRLASSESEAGEAGTAGTAETKTRALQKLRRDSSTVEGPLRNPAQSAVLVLLSGDAGVQQRPDDASVVLIHRATTLRHHAGQMAFPGGRVDPGDKDAVDTALREAEEETGLDRSTVTPVRVLDSIDISRTGFAVNPVLAYWHAPHPLRVVDPAETDEVLNVPISHLADPENRMMLGYSGWKGPAFKVGDFVVWGFTGGVLSYLLDAAGWAEPWDDTRVRKLLPVLARSANGERLSELMRGRRR